MFIIQLSLLKGETPTEENEAFIAFSTSVDSVSGVNVGLF
jgi:hypothetical protein